MAVKEIKKDKEKEVSVKDRKFINALKAWAQRQSDQQLKDWDNED